MRPQGGYLRHLPPDPARAQKAYVLRNRRQSSLFGRGWFKWWRLELRPFFRLTRREVRRLEIDLMGKWDTAHRYGGHVGEDGAVFDQWWDKYPGLDSQLDVERALQHLGGRGQVRAVPYGFRCRCPELYPEQVIEQWGELRYCELGVTWSCDPPFLERDWQQLDSAGQLSRPFLLPNDGRRKNDGIYL